MEEEQIQRRTMLQPCHHVATCVDCAEQLKRAAKPCPVRFCSAAAAGEPVRNWVQVFFK
jgi:hypothetical protein